MGIRVHKMLGWGLTDLKVKKPVRGEVPELDDPRVNPEGYLAFLAAGEDGDGAPFGLDRYLKFLKRFKWQAVTGEEQLSDIVRKPTLERLLLRDGDELQATALGQARSRWPFNYCVYEREFGDARVVCIRPAIMHQWFRWDDAVDYVEETMNHQGAVRVVELREPVYPFNTLQEDTVTHTIIRGEKADLLRWNRIQGKPEPKDWRWIVPADVAAVCKFLKLFRDDETIRTLKPLLYVWWS